MSWFTLSIPKGKMKKRAHKKLMKGKVGRYIDEVQAIIESEIISAGFQSRLDKDIKKFVHQYGMYGELDPSGFTA